MRTAASTPESDVIVVPSATRLVQTRYDMRGYREPVNPAVRHEAHAVYRSTRVSIRAPEEFEIVPRSTYFGVSYAPLPASEELAAEIATQKQVTANLRELQKILVDTEQGMQVQYAALVRQGAEIAKVRDQLEAERQRLRISTGAPAAVAPPVIDPVTPPAKW